MRPGANGAGLSRKAIMTEIDHSLRRLGTDYVDVYMVHRLDQRTPLEETLEERHGWARFITMQDHYNLLAREEEREMLPLCASEGVGTMVWSPLARGRLARDLGKVAGNRGVSRAQVARAWLRHQPVVAAPLVGASSPGQIDDAVASLDLELTGDELAELERPYTPRYDFQGVSDDAEIARIRAQIPGMNP